MHALAFHRNWRLLDGVGIQQRMSTEHKESKRARRTALTNKIKELYGEQLPCTAFLSASELQVRAVAVSAPPSILHTPLPSLPQLTR